jgi:uncharacterized protein (DUF58 family)
MTLGKRHALLWGPLFIFIVAFVLHVNQMFVMFCSLCLLAPVSFALGRHKLAGVSVSRHARSVMTAGEMAFAASLATEAIGRGCTVGLLSVGHHDHSVPASASTRQKLQIMEALARVQADASTGLLATVTTYHHTLPRASSVALVSPDHSPEVLAAIARLASLGHGVTWFALARHTFDGRLSAEHAAYESAVGLAAARGATVIRVRGDAPLQASLLRRGDRGGRR